MSAFAAFQSIPTGTKIKNHGYDQCVALANHYWENTLGLPLPIGIGSAYQWWTTRYSQPNLTRNATFSDKPVAGALFVARYGRYNAPDGHIGVVTSVNGDGTFNTMEQNAENNRYVARYTRGMANILGFIIPNNNPATPVATQPAAYARTQQRKEDPMHFVVLTQQARSDGSAAYAIYRPGVKGSWEEFDSSSGRGMMANSLASQFGQPTEVSLQRWVELQKKYA